MWTGLQHIFNSATKAQNNVLRHKNLFTPLIYMLMLIYVNV
jgi:hypothetical protein